MANNVGIAVDGGGSKTLVVVHDYEGHVLGRARVGATNPNSVGEEAASAALSSGIEEALAAAHRSRADVSRVCLGMSGADRPADCRRFESWARRAVGDHATCRAVNDGAVALASATRGVLEGVVVISGTGTVALAFARGGEDSRRAAGWGPLLGDEGSGHAIGSAALRAATHASDSRGPQTTILPTLLARLGLAAPIDLLEWAYGDASKANVWQNIAGLAPVVLECAKAGDAVAARILDEAADGLAASVRAVARGLGHGEQSEFDVVFAGGLLQHEGSPVADRLRARISAEFKRAKILLAHEEPVMGAVFLNVASLKALL